MNRSKTIALILSPSLAMAGLLLAAYWVEMRDAQSEAPLELHALASGKGVAPPMTVMDPSDGRAIANAPQAIVPSKPDIPAAEPAPSQQAALSADKPAEPAVAPPKFDVVRVEPSGDALIAGHTEPGVAVAVVANGKVIGEGKADASGQFVILPPPLPPGEHGLSLRITPHSGAPVMSDQNVAVSVPIKGQHDVMVALAEPGKATVLLTDPTAQPQAPAAEQAPPVDQAKPPVAEKSPAVKTPPAPAKSAKLEQPPMPAAAPAKPADEKKSASAAVKPEVAVKTVEVVEPGGFFATGIASPGSHLHIYLNDSPLAEVIAGPDGHWTVKVVKGLVPGHYAVRVDQSDASGSVVARAEVPFDYAPAVPPKLVAEAKKVEPAPAQATPPKPAAPAKEAEAPPAPIAAAKPTVAAKEAEVAPAQIAPSKPAAPAEAKAAPAEGAEASAKEAETEAPKPAETQHQETVASTAASDAVSTLTADASQAQQAGSATIAEIQTATVEKGNSLWRISRGRLGFGSRYTEIYTANASQIRDPKLIYPGQVFVIPQQTN